MDAYLLQQLSLRPVPNLEFDYKFRIRLELQKDAEVKLR